MCGRCQCSWLSWTARSCWPPSFVSTAMPTEICCLGIHTQRQWNCACVCLRVCVRLCLSNVLLDWLWVIQIPYRALIPLLIDLASFISSVFILNRLGHHCLIWDSLSFMRFCFLPLGLCNTAADVLGSTRTSQGLKCMIKDKQIHLCLTNSSQVIKYECSWFLQFPKC